MIMPIFPLPSAKLYSLAGPISSELSMGTSSYFSLMSSTISCPNRTLSRSQALSASKGMNSMKRISKPSDRPISIRPMISVSEKLRIATALILIDLNPALRAASRPSRTDCRQSRRLTSWNFSGSSESRLTFSLFNPASARLWAWSLRKKALVVMAISSMPSTVFSILIRLGRSFLISGSPPVRRIRLIPNLETTVTTRWISSNVSRLLRSMNSTLSAGMQ